MYVEMVSGGQPFTAGRVCFFQFAPWVSILSINIMKTLLAEKKYLHHYNNKLTADWKIGWEWEKCLDNNNFTSHYSIFGHLTHKLINTLKW